MWSYYGAKTNVVDFYPKPKHHKIIEPFAGSARYALKYFESDVLLVDKYEVIVKIWKWLQLCSQKDILSLPRTIKAKENLDSYSFDCEEAKMLMGFCIGFGSTSPRNISTPRLDLRPNHLNFSLNRIARNLFKIKHWEIRLDSYENIINQSATWFIDPPYQYGGHAYSKNNAMINFTILAEWVESREGQVIACENSKADWMKFKPLVKQKVRTGINYESIWLNEISAFNNTQIDLFA